LEVSLGQLEDDNVGTLSVDHVRVELSRCDSRQPRAMLPEQTHKQFIREGIVKEHHTRA
jgi:hypothetical protein